MLFFHFNVIIFQRFIKLNLSLFKFYKILYYKRNKYYNTNFISIKHKKYVFIEMKGD